MQINAIRAITIISQPWFLRDRREVNKTVVNIMAASMLITPPLVREMKTAATQSPITITSSHNDLAALEVRNSTIPAGVDFLPAKISCSLTQSNPSAAPIDRFMNCPKLL